MACRTAYSADDCRLLDALFALVASCGSLVAEDPGWEERQLPSGDRQRLEAALRGLAALALLGRIIAERPWSEERSAIRGGRLANTEPKFAKAIPVEDGEEQARDS